MLTAKLHLLAFTNLQCFIALRQTHLLCFPHKLECLAFTRTAHRYLDFRSKQHSSSSGFSPWPPLYGRVISCILPKKVCFSWMGLQTALKQLWNFLVGFLPKQWPVAAELQSLPHWSVKKKFDWVQKKFDRVQKKFDRGEKIWSGAEKFDQAQKKMNSIWTLPSSSRDVDQLKPCV